MRDQVVLGLEWALGRLSLYLLGKGDQLDTDFLVDDVSSLPNTGTQSVASGATGMASILIGVAALMMAGAYASRRHMG